MRINFIDGKDKQTKNACYRNSKEIRKCSLVVLLGCKTVGIFFFGTSYKHARSSNETPGTSEEMKRETGERDVFSPHSSIDK